MTLEHEACFRRLDTLLRYHGRLVAQNRDATTMRKVEVEIEKVQTELEKLNASPISQTVVR